MSLLDDTAIFAAIISEGGFGRAAAKLGLSNGLVSRRIANLEKELGVSLLKRTTRQLQLTPEGELFWEHARRIQQEMDAALCMIHSLANKPTGNIRLSATPFFGRHFLMPMLNQFAKNFENITTELILTSTLLDPIKENIDLLIRTTGFFDDHLKDSSLKTTLLVKNKIKLYAAPEYLLRKGVPANPEALLQHDIVGYIHPEKPLKEQGWKYQSKNDNGSITLKTAFNCNDVDSQISACLAGRGIGKFTELVHMNLTDKNSLQPVLENYSWGEMNMYAVYATQQALPTRTRLFLDFIIHQTKHLREKI